MFFCQIFAISSVLTFKVYIKWVNTREYFYNISFCSILQDENHIELTNRKGITTIIPNHKKNGCHNRNNRNQNKRKQKSQIEASSDEGSDCEIMISSVWDSLNITTIIKVLTVRSWVCGTHSTSLHYKMPYQDTLRTYYLGSANFILLSFYEGLYMCL